MILLGCSLRPWLPLYSFALLAVLLLGQQQIANAIEIHSPDGNITLEVELKEESGEGVVCYSVTRNGTAVLADSAISFTTADGKSIGQHLRPLGDAEFRSADSTWHPVYGERSEIRDQYQQVCLRYEDTTADCRLRLEFRCYDIGIAFRTVIEPTPGQSSVELAAEHSEFRFVGDHPAWRTTTAQGSYDMVPLSQLGRNVERPLVVQIHSQLYAAILEAGVVDYAPMTLRGDQQNETCVVSQLGSSVHAKGPLTTPWRVVMVAATAGKLLEGNDLVLNLNEPCAIADTSWIKPGKVLREVSLTTAGAKRCIDFAAKHHLQYVEFDAGWYGNEYNDKSDATTVTVDPKRSAGPLDLPEVVRYAKQHDIGIILYVNRRALEQQLDELLPLYQAWGIAGVKYGFVNTGTQRWSTWLHDAIRKAAAHELMVDVHDNYRPTGYSRTYPNLMTQEGVRGDEETPSGSQALTTLFTRYLAGAGDFTVCYFNERVAISWTHGHQLGKAVCTYSPWQFLFWYDAPLDPEHTGSVPAGRIAETPELEFFAKMPTVWDETRVLTGEIGEYAVIARRSGQQWFVGAMNNKTERTLQLPMDFLSEGEQYQAKIYRDDPSLETITKIRVDEESVDAQSSLSIKLLPNGGQAMLLTPAKE
ncbi:glycoside hydrolase family 97 protein [Aeoliella mucimassa]|uniref:Retaining alpha-galactosidase n=1 Tax=Aeoliella mucimassa TaxID=2527972 RepID=A0A518ARM1_9BACT|nr:glycoside hydrolase family 97 protein [Aeoliella mucimassa]QDU57362.1 Retaining alpha-galactosidase precursor [Aeoliella mucimassa]